MPDIYKLVDFAQEKMREKINGSEYKDKMETDDWKWGDGEKWICFSFVLNIKRWDTGNPRYDREPHYDWETTDPYGWYFDSDSEISAEQQILDWIDDWFYWIK